jgi:cytochrome c peroxidase
MKPLSSCGPIALALGITFAAQAAEDDALLRDARRLFAPLPKDMATAARPITPALIELGRALFFDPPMSVDGTASCARCHQPALYGGDALAKSHGHHDRLNARNAPTVLNAAPQINQHWAGNDKFLFKVPILRNVAMTGPYFHDGPVGSLEAAVRTMARVQLGATPSNKEVQDIAAFLGSLTGQLPQNFATAPALPAER